MNKLVDQRSSSSTERRAGLIIVYGYIILIVVLLDCLYVLNIVDFRDSFWPNGTLAEQRLPRDHNTKMRTRVVCKSKLFASLSGMKKTNVKIVGFSV
jgi:hypothetical protein